MAEILGAISIVSIGAAWKRFERTREWHEVQGVHFLKVFDVPWTEGEQTPELPVLKGSPAELQQALQTLPSPIPRCYRFYVSENMPDIIQKSGIRATPNLPQAATASRYSTRGTDSSSFAGLRSQWRDPNGAQTWLSTSYSILFSRSPHTTKLIRLTKKIDVLENHNSCVHGKFV